MQVSKHIVTGLIKPAQRALGKFQQNGITRQLGTLSTQNLIERTSSSQQISQSGIVSGLQKILESQKETLNKFESGAVFPYEATIELLGSTGYTGVGLPEDIGGIPTSTVDYAAFHMTLGEYCPTIAVAVSINKMCAEILSKHGDKNLFSDILEKAVTFEAPLSFAMTEPGVGTDAKNMKTTASYNADTKKWILNGSKTFISSIPQTVGWLVFAQTETTEGHKVSLFYVPKDTKGFQISKPSEKIGWKALSSQDLFFDDCEIPKNHLIGSLGKGINIGLSGLSRGRIAISSQSIGNATQALQTSLQIINDRQLKGSPMLNHPTILSRYGNIYERLLDSTILLFEAAKQLDYGVLGADDYTSYVKSKVTQEAWECFSEAADAAGGAASFIDSGFPHRAGVAHIFKTVEGANRGLDERFRRQLITNI